MPKHKTRGLQPAMGQKNKVHSLRNKLKRYEERVAAKHEASNERLGKPLRYCAATTHPQSEVTMGPADRRRRVTDR